MLYSPTFSQTPNGDGSKIITRYLHLSYKYRISHTNDTRSSPFPPPPVSCWSNSRCLLYDARLETMAISPPHFFLPFSSTYIRQPTQLHKNVYSAFGLISQDIPQFDIKNAEHWVGLWVIDTWIRINAIIFFITVDTAVIISFLRSGHRDCSYQRCFPWLE